MYAGAQADELIAYAVEEDVDSDSGSNSILTKIVGEWDIVGWLVFSVSFLGLIVICTCSVCWYIRRKNRRYHEEDEDWYALD